MGEVIETVSVSESIRCPGCHFECMLAKYQCGRGKEFYDIAAAGGEVPVRRGPMMTPSERAACPDGKPPLDGRVMHALFITAGRLQSLRPAEGGCDVVSALARTGSFMSVPMLAKRMRVAADDLEQALGEACEAGLVNVEADGRFSRVASLTDAGMRQAAQRRAEDDERTAAFLSALSDEEKETLAALLRKLLDVGA